MLFLKVKECETSKTHKKNHDFLLLSVVFKMNKYPQKQGLYNPIFEHDSCGVGFVVHIKNHKSHKIIQNGLGLLCNLNHRGALGADPETGDGSGIMIQIPHQFFLKNVKMLRN